MGRKPSIPAYYKPLQPFVKLNEGDVIYKEVQPDLRLSEFVYCYWQLQSKGKLEENYLYNVVADGCIDVFFELNNPQNSFVMGFCNSHTQFPLEKSFNYVGIRFMPTAFTRLFNVKALEMSNRFESLDLVAPNFSLLISNTVKDTFTLPEIKTTFLCNYISGNDIKFDKRFDGALFSIIQSKGLINIETDIDTGISPRQLRRMFEFYVGTNAKTFSKVVRFQNALRMAQENRFLQDRLFYDAGYYDQAHFIKDFKLLYGTTPGKALDK